MKPDVNPSTTKFKKGLNPWSDEEFGKKQVIVRKAILSTKQVLCSFLFILFITFIGFIIIPYTLFRGPADWLYLILYGAIIFGGSYWLGSYIQLINGDEDGGEEE